MLETRAASQYSLAQLAEIFNAAYEGYIVPVSFDAAALARRIVSEHIDLGASHVLIADGNPVGVMLIARRGRQSRLAALGIALPKRGQGLGRQAVDLALSEARTRADTRMRLEVITSNLPAQRTYLAAGFATMHQLVAYERDASASPAPLPADYEFCDDASELMAHFGHALSADLPWQIAPQSLAGIVSPARALRRRDGRAAALFDASGVRPRLLSIAVSPQARSQGLGSELLQTLLHSTPGFWQIPALVPETLIDGFLTRHGWQRGALAQFEMQWHP